MKIDATRLIDIIDELLDETDGDFCITNSVKIGLSDDIHGKTMQVLITVTCDEDEFIDSTSDYICIDFQQGLNK